ncbi:MAG: ABC transporter permease [Acidimicrobiales bacterium]
MIGTIRLLALRRLRRQPLRAAIAAVAVATGVALAVAIGVVVTSLNRSFDEYGRTLAGPTPLRVLGPTSRGGLTLDAVAAIETTPGVAAVVPLVQAVTLAEDAEGREVPIVAFGVDCRVEALIGPLGCTPEALAAVGERPIAVGAELSSLVGGGGVVRSDVGRIALGGVPAVGQLDQLNDGRVVVFTLEAARRLFGRPTGVDVAYVQPGADVDIAGLRDLLAQSVGSHNKVLSASDPLPQVGFVLALFVPLLGIIGLFALGTGGVLVYNTVTLSLEERRRQLAIVAALGGTARVVVIGTLVEAGLLGVAGGLLGALGGILVARPITDTVSGITEQVAGISVTAHAGSGTFVVGALIGLLVAVLAAVIPTRRALRLDVAAELTNRTLREDSAPAVRWRRTIVPAIIAGSGLFGCWLAQREGGLEPWQATLAPVALLVSTVGNLLLAASLAATITRWWQPAAERLGAPAGLAVANLRREPRRTGVMAVAVGTTLLVAFVTASFTRAVRHEITTSIRRGLDGVAVSTIETGFSVAVEAKISPDTLATLTSLPEVGRVDRLAAVVVGQDADQLIGVSAYEHPWLDARLIVGAKDEGLLNTGQVIVGPAVARDEGVRPGDFLRLPTPNGFVDVPVQGVWHNGDFGGRNVQMSYELLERLYGPQPPLGVNLSPVPGVSIEQLAAAVEAANRDPDLLVWTPDELAALISEDVEDQLAPFWVMQRALLVIAFVAVLSTLLLVGVQRRRELGMLAAVGMRPSELARMVMAEAGLVGCTGVVLGTVFGVVTLKALLFITPVMFGFLDPFTPDYTALIMWGAVAVAVAVLASAWPAWRTARIEVLDAIRYE